MLAKLLQYAVWFSIIMIVIAFLPSVESYPLPDWVETNANYFFAYIQAFFNLPILGRLWYFVQMWLGFWIAIQGINLIFKIIGLFPDTDKIDKLKIKG